VRQVTPEFRLDANNVAVVAEICRRLDGIPLALELAAARMQVLSPSAFLQRLDRRLNLLSGGSVDLPERQRTLRNTDLVRPARPPAGPAATSTCPARATCERHCHRTRC
jgi:predicted ATPase